VKRHACDQCAIAAAQPRVARRDLTGAARYDLGSAWTVVPSRPNSNTRSHWREPELSAANFHFLAASLATRLKYLLGPGRSRLSCTTRPELSTVTRTPTFTRPRIVLRALAGTLGTSSWTADDVAFDGNCSRVPTAGLVGGVCGAFLAGGGGGMGCRPVAECGDTACGRVPAGAGRGGGARVEGSVDEESAAVPGLVGI
jgi:hypothetical protein